MLSELLNKRAVIIIISIIWGLGLAILFRKSCDNDKCVVVKAPLELAHSGNIIRSGNRCYELKRYYSECVY